MEGYTLKINMNDMVRVKLTPAGQARWKGLFGEAPTINIRIPIWELMQVFGPGMHMGMTEMYFVDNEIELCVKT